MPHAPDQDPDAPLQPPVKYYQKVARERALRGNEQLLSLLTAPQSNMRRQAVLEVLLRVRDSIGADQDPDEQVVTFDELVDIKARSLDLKTLISEALVEPAQSARGDGMRLTQAGVNKAEGIRNARNGPLLLARMKRTGDEKEHAQTARQLAKEVDDFFATAPRRKQLHRWQQEFEKEMQPCLEQAGEVHKARNAVATEITAVTEGRRKPRLTRRDRRPHEGYVWCEGLGVIPVSSSVSLRRVNDARTVGGWVPESVQKYLAGDRKLPWECEPPSLATRAMMLALFHDKYFKQGAPLLGAAQDDSEPMKSFRELCRFDDWEQYTSVDQLSHPPIPFGENRLDILATYLNNIRAHLALREFEADGREAEPDGGGRNVRPWTQHDLDKAIGEYQARRGASYSELVANVKKGLPGAQKEARKIFGRNVVARALGVKSASMVSASPVWYAMASELGLPLQRKKAKGTRHTRHPGKVPLDIAVERARPTGDALASSSELEGAEREKTLQLVRELAESGPEGKRIADGLYQGLTGGDQSDEEVRASVRTALKSRK